MGLPVPGVVVLVWLEVPLGCGRQQDRKSTRLNSSHDQISYAVFCLKKKKSIKNFRSQRKRTRLYTRHQHTPRDPSSLTRRPTTGRGHVTDSRALQDSLITCRDSRR